MQVSKSTDHLVQQYIEFHMKNVLPTFSFLFGRSEEKIVKNLNVCTALSPHSERLALEPRIVFDGAGAGVATAIADDGMGDAQDDMGVEADVNIAELAGLGDREALSEVSEIAFIDMRVPDAEDLATSMRDNVLVVFLDPAKDGVAQINQALSAFENIESVHLFTHAENDGFLLGNTAITAETVEDNAAGLSAWQSYLSQDADILFYGCDLAENATGQSILSRISDLTGADISASDDLTGSADLGGDWDLEYNIGTIESTLSITAQGQVAYAHVLAAVPEATFTPLSEDPLLGEQFTATVTFDNTSGVDTGFGPYVNLFLPFTGVDGVYNAGTDTYTSSADGVSFVGATYLGSTVESTVITLEDIDAGAAGIQFEHPEAIDTAGDPLVVTLDNALGLVEGDQLVLLKLPFGSYTPGQPDADIVVTLAVSGDADADTGLDVITSAGFKFGNTAENDFDTDPSIQAATLNAGNTNSLTVTPKLFRLTTTLNAPEGETATGPNFERSYDVEIEVAPGQTIDNASLDFVLSESMVYTSGSSTGGGVLDITSLGQATGGDLSDDLFTVDFATLSGTQTVSVNFYIDEFDQAGADVLDPLTGASRVLGETNNVDLAGTWTPNDGRDNPNTPVSDTSSAAQITARSIAVQKSVAIDTDTGSTGATPGDTLVYTIIVQISDFFAYDTITIEDIFDDGQLLDGNAPTLTVTRQGTTSGPFDFTDGVDFTDTTIAGDDHRIDFDVSALLIAQLASGILEGGKFGADDLAGTTATISYKTIIQDEYDSNAGNLNVKQGDTLSNTVTVQGRLLDGALTPIAGPVLVTDGSGASVTVPNNNVSLSIYALNNSTAGTLTDIKPGDDVTFRLEYDLVTGDLEDFFLDAYLPLPIFSMDDINADGAGGDSFVLDNGTVIPTVGDFRYGPTATTDITTGIPTPTATTDVGSNFVRFDLGDLADATNDGGKIDILFTVRATDEPFADGLLLTTLSQQSDSNSPSAPSVTNDLQQITLLQPEINSIIKGVVSTNNTGGTYASGTPSGIKVAGNTDANPLSTTVTSANLASLNLDNDLSDVDDGDLVRFAVIVENTGSGPNGAFDVTIGDLIPAGMEVPGGGLNLRVVNGNGVALAFTDNGVAGSEVFDLTLNDGATGALAGSNGPAGDNIVIITYDLLISDAAEAQATFMSDATLSNFANREGGPDFTAVDVTDGASVTIDGADVAKTITDTTQAHTTGNNVVVGEIIEYTVVITVPEGMSSTAMLNDTLDAGLAFVGVDSITFSAGGDITSTNGNEATILTNEVSFSNVGGGGDNDGRLLTIDFGDITNANTNNAAAETITIVYSAIVVNTASSNGGAALNNAANWTTDNDDFTRNAPDVTVVEPQVNVTVTPNVTEADVGDTVTWTVVVTAPAGNLANAFDVDFNNVIPAGLTYVASSLSHDSGVVPASFTENGGDFNATYSTLTAGQTSTFTFQTTIDSGASLGQMLTNAGTATWHSTLGTQGDLSPHTNVDTERTGLGTPAINDYTNTGNGVVSILNQAPTLALDDTSEAATAGNDVAPGEIVRYRFTVRVPESTTSDFRVETDLPAGLQYLNDGTTTIAFIDDGGISSDSATLSGAGLNITGNETSVGTDEPTFTLNGANIATAGNNAEFLLGEITNADSDVNQEFIVIEFNALVLNDANVNDATSLIADVDVKEGATVLSTTNMVTLDVTEPALSNLQKTVIDTDGTTVTYQITFENMSGADAFDINISDNVPANLSNLRNVNVATAAGVTGVTDNSTATGLDIDITDFPNGGSVTITYTADVTNNTMTVADSDVDVTWTSVDGAAATLGASTAGTAGTGTGERTGSGAPALNDYTIAEGAGLNIVTGTLWEDANMNNAIGGTETLIANTQINLLWSGADGIFGNADDITLTTLTDATGDYTFGALPAGDYRISVQPSGQPNGLDPTYDPVFDPSGAANDNLISITLGEGVTNAGNIFGVFDVPNTPDGADKSVITGTGQTLRFSPSDFGFTDPDFGDVLDNVHIDTLPALGTFQLNGVDVVAGQVIPVAQIANLTYVPEDDQAGTPTNFTFSVQDQTGLFDPAPNTFTINVSDTSYVIPPDPTPIFGSGTVPPLPPYGGYNGIGPDGVDPTTGLRVFQVGFKPFQDINFDHHISRPDFWLAGTVDQKLMIETKEMSFQVPRAIFRHSNPGEQLSFEAELSDGSPLPDWLSFDDGDLSFRGTPPLGSPKELEIVIIARDTNNEELKAPVRILIMRDVEGGKLTVPEIEENNTNDVDENGSNNDNPAKNKDNDTQEDDKQGFLILDQPPGSEGRPSFTDQLQDQSKLAQFKKQEAFLSSLS